MLQRFKKREGDAREIYEDKWTVSEKIEFILKAIAEQGSVRFSELFADAASRSEVVCTFLALLELIRLKQLSCAQPEPFAEIEISSAATTTTTSQSVEATDGSSAETSVASVEPTTVENAGQASSPSQTEVKTET